MPKPTYENALIVGAGRGLSASLARILAGKGLRVALAARDAGEAGTALRRDRRQGLRLRCRRARSGGASLHRGRGRDRRARRRCL